MLKGARDKDGGLLRQPFYYGTNDAGLFNNEVSIYVKLCV